MSLKNTLGLTFCIASQGESIGGESDATESSLHVHMIAAVVCRHFFNDVCLDLKAIMASQRVSTFAWFEEEREKQWLKEKKC